MIDSLSEETQEKYKDSHLFKPWMKVVRLRQISSIQELKEYLEKNEEKKEVSWDIETESLDPNPNTLVGHCLSFDVNEAVYIPTRHKNFPNQNLDHDKVWELILQTIEHRKLVVFNYSFEGSCLRKLGINRPAKGDRVKDILLYNWLHDSSAMRLNLKDAVKKILGFEMLNIHEVPGIKLDAKAKGKINFGLSNPNDACLYAAADPVMTLRLYHNLKDEIEQNQRFILELEHAVLDSLAWMQATPLLVDRAFLKQGREDLNRWIRVVAAEIYKDADYEFNIGSTAEAIKYFEKKKVNLKKKSRIDKRSGLEVITSETNEKAMLSLAGKHRSVDLVLLYRKLLKERSTYLDSLLNDTTEDSPYIIFKFKSAGAPTGRFSSGGRDEGEIQFASMNSQSIPSSSSHRFCKCRLLSNPPLEQMNAVFLGISLTDGVKVEEETEEEKQDDLFEEEE